MLKKIGLPVMALMALAFAPAKADARVRFGVTFGGPVYAAPVAPAPVAPYAYPYQYSYANPYADPYYAPPAYVAPAPVYVGPYASFGFGGGWGHGHYDRGHGHFDRGFGGGYGGFRGRR